MICWLHFKLLFASFDFEPLAKQQPVILNIVYHLGGKCTLGLGKDGVSKTDEFSEKFQKGGRGVMEKRT